MKTIPFSAAKLFFADALGNALTFRLSGEPLPREIGEHFTVHAGCEILENSDW